MEFHCKQDAHICRNKSRDRWRSAIQYLGRIEKKGAVNPDTLDVYLTSHWIDPELCRGDRFDEFIIDRAKKLLDAISAAMGKAVNGRDSEEVIQRFGASLT